MTGIVVDYELHLSAQDKSFKLTPQNLPAHVLAEYLQALTSLIAAKKHRKDLILNAVVDGSATIQLSYNQEKEVTSLPTAANDDEYTKVLEIMEKYGHQGTLIDIRNTKKIELNPESLMDDLVVYQEESYTGQVIKIGGNDKTVHLDLKNPSGQVYKLTLNDARLAKEIGQNCFFGERIICYGKGKIRRKKKGFMVASAK